MAEKKKTTKKSSPIDAGKTRDAERAETPRSDGDGLSLSNALFMAESEDNVALKKLVGESAPLDEELTPPSPPVKKKSYKVNAGSKTAPKQYQVKEERKTEKAPVKGSYDPSAPHPDLPQVDVKGLYDSQPLPSVPPEKTEPSPAPVSQNNGGAYGLGVKFAVKEKRVKGGGEERSLYDPDGISGDELLAQMAHNELYLDRLNAQRKRRRLTTIIILAILCVMLLMFGVAAIVTFSGGFTVSLDGGGYGRGITLYDNASLQNGSSYLASKKMPEYDNITYGQFKDYLLTEIDGVDGLHSVSGKYFAYTFYVVNNGAKTIDYDIAVNILSASKGLDDAIRVLVIEDTTFYGASDNRRNAVVTAKPAVDENGDWKFENGNPVMQTLVDIHGNPLDVQDNAVCFRDRTTTYYRRFNGLQNTTSKNIHKYTVMAYLEGGDPDCNNEIRGGGIKMNVEMKVYE